MPKRNPKERWYLDRMKNIFAEIGVPITKPDRDWNAIKRMEAVRHCITHSGSIPDKGSGADRIVGAIRSGVRRGDAGINASNSSTRSRSLGNSGRSAPIAPVY